MWDQFPTMPDSMLPPPRSMTHKRLPIILFIAGMLLIGSVGILAMRHFSAHQPVHATGHTRDQASATAYHPSAIAATATPKSRANGHIITGATLGGTKQALVEHYGPSPNAVWVIGVDMAFSANFDDGVDGQPRAFQIVVYQLDGATWTLGQAQGVCTPFLPPDAHDKGKSSDNQGNMIGVYFSADLAATFPAIEFGPDQPGTVNIDYERASGGAIYQCVLSV
jgi:hypothetical protein